MSASRRTVLVTGTDLAPPQALELIRERGFDVRHIPRDDLDREELHADLDGVAGYLLGGEEAPLDEHFERAAALEVVAFTGTDFKKFIPGWQRAIDLGVAVANTPGANARSVAEFTMLLVLAMARPFTGCVKGGGTLDAPAQPGFELRGRTLGLLGAGRIGAQVAVIAGQGFGMRTLYHAPRRNHPLEEATGLRHVSKEQLLAEADVVSLHRPGSTGPDDVPIGAAELALMRPGAVLVDAGHPSLVDPVALAVAVRERGIRAAFDGYGEGPGWTELLARPPAEVLIVPSMAYNTADANLRTGLGAAGAVCDVLSGRPSPLVVSPAGGRQRTAEARSATALPS